jgi:hypothetical protein
MRSFRVDTLAYQLGVRPGCTHRNLGSVRLKHTASSVRHLLTVGKDCHTMAGFPSTGENIQVSPERDAILFYLLSHAVSVIRKRYNIDQPLGDCLEILEMFHKEMAVRFVRMFSYLLLINTRESRHVKGKPITLVNGAPILPALSEFHGRIRGITDPDAAVASFYTNPPDVSLEQFTSFLTHVMYRGQFSSSSFGGPLKWGKIADCLHSFVTGKTTAEMMMDTAYTLEHNTSSIFNKGMLYQMSGSEMAMILDVQRSGQIPNYVVDKTTGIHSLCRDDDRIQEVWKKCFHLLGEDFSGRYVDWVWVKLAAGDAKVGGYTNQTTAQLKKHGPSPHEPVNAAPVATEAEVWAKKFPLKSGPHIPPNSIQVFPGKYIQKVKAKR